MPIARRIFIYVQAYHYQGDGMAAINWEANLSGSEETKLVIVGEGLYIDTLEGRIRVSVGDWIMAGLNGELYSCKPDIFEQNYDVLDEPLVIS